MPSHPAPIVLKSPSDTGCKLSSTTAGPGDAMSESWLRDTIVAHRELLPVEHFDERFGPLIPLGIEIGSGSGPIDALFVSPSGRLTIVETKLWKSPERHRDVVAQVIDYAKSVARMTIDELNAAIADERDGATMDSIVAAWLAKDGAGRTLDAFHESLATRMTAGDFLLLIVGDRISPRAALLGDAIVGAPGLRFTLGFVELQLCRLGDGEWPMLVVPHVVGRTVERERLVVRVENAMPGARVIVAPSEDHADEEGGAVRRRYATLDDLLNDPDLPPHAAEAIRAGAARWREVGTLSVKKRSVRWMADVRGEPHDLLLTDSYRLAISRPADLVASGAAAREAYFASLRAIPPVRACVDAGQMYVGYDELPGDAIGRIVDATIALATDRMKIRAGPSRT